jgi:hypothetical protein
MKCRRWILACALLVSATGPVAAQAPDWLLPATRHFENPIADPLEPRLGIGLISTNVLRIQGPERPVFTRPVDTRELHAAVSIGATVPMFRVAEWDGGGIVVVAQAGVNARFRIERPSRDDFGQDWLVSMPVEVRWQDLSARLRITHRSSHLGDEFSRASGAERIEFGGESFDGLVATRIRGLRVYAGGGWIFHSNTDNTNALVSAGRSDRFFVQTGADFVWKPWSNDLLDIVGGIDWQSAERTKWQETLGVAAGIRLHAGTRGLRLALRYVSGVSSLGQFFLTPEDYFGIELGIIH